MSDLTGFLNVGKLEGVISAITTRLEAALSRIDALERTVAESVPLSSYRVLSTRVEQMVAHCNAHFGAVDERFGEISEEVTSMSERVAALPHMQAQIDARLEVAAFQHASESTRNELVASLTALRNEKASKSTVSSLESSQHRIVEELVALQAVIACKIDRVEVPLLDVASEKLQYLLDFQQTADARLESIEGQATTMGKVLERKESKETVTNLMAEIRNELDKKVDGAFIKQQVMSQSRGAEEDRGEHATIATESDRRARCCMRTSSAHCRSCSHPAYAYL
jgi:DNA-binding FrmR family transcriptional regulator